MCCAVLMFMTDSYEKLGKNQCTSYYLNWKYLKVSENNISLFAILSFCRDVVIVFSSDFNDFMFEFILFSYSNHACICTNNQNQSVAFLNSHFSPFFAVSAAKTIKELPRRAKPCHRTIIITDQSGEQGMHKNVNGDNRIIRIRFGEEKGTTWLDIFVHPLSDRRGNFFCVSKRKWFLSRSTLQR